MKRELSYEDIKSSFKTGDLILFHGNEISSRIIEVIEWSYWSHVGMVIRPEDIGLSGNEPLLWESTASGDGIVDVINMAPKESGPMLIPLHDRLSIDVEKGYDTHFKVKYASRPFTNSELESLHTFIYKAHS